MTPEPFHAPWVRYRLAMTEADIREWCLEVRREY
jgi:hypothetical protein